MLFIHSFMCLLRSALFGVPVKGLERQAREHLYSGWQGLKPYSSLCELREPVISQLHSHCLPYFVLFYSSHTHLISQQKLRRLVEACAVSLHEVCLIPSSYLVTLNTVLWNSSLFQGPECVSRHDVGPNIGLTTDFPSHKDRSSVLLLPEV